jgi:hypothetical protein
VNPSVLVELANLQRRRRWDTAPQAPFADAGQARRALAEDGVAISGLTQGDLPSLARLADAVSELADCLALRRPPVNADRDTLRALADEGNEMALDRLADLADQGGDLEELNDLPDEGCRRAGQLLTARAVTKGDLRELQRLSDAGCDEAGSELNRLLAGPTPLGAN